MYLYVKVGMYVFYLTINNCMYLKRGLCIILCVYIKCLCIYRYNVLYMGLIHTHSHIYMEKSVYIKWVGERLCICTYVLYIICVCLYEYIWYYL